MTHGIFKGQGYTGKTGPEVQKTVNKNKNSEADDSIRKYAQKPKMDTGDATPVTDYARMVKVGGNDMSAVDAALKQSPRGEISPPVAASESYDEIATKVPTYRGRPKQGVLST